MNRKMICYSLERIHKKFIESIEDSTVRSLVAKNTIITGGAITSLLLNEEVNDFDYYFTDKETVLCVARYFIKKFLKDHPNCRIEPEVVEREGRILLDMKGIGVADMSTTEVSDRFNFETSPEAETEINLEKADEVNAEKSKELTPYRPIYLTSNAITLSEKIQLIIRFYGTPEQIHENFDFEHCKNYWVSNGNQLHLNQSALESILAKQLYYTGSLYPVSSVIRTRKYIKRGWHINAGQYLKMCFQIAELDLTDVNVLEDQLVGVDSAYFKQIIDACRQKQDKDSSFSIDSAYLTTIVDKIF